MDYTVRTVDEHVADAQELVFARIHVLSFDAHHMRRGDYLISCDRIVFSNSIDQRSFFRRDRRLLSFFGVDGLGKTLSD